MVTNSAECKATGGGIFKQQTLSPLEEAVANLLQFQKQINPEGDVQGVQCQGQNAECELLELVEETANSVDLDLANILASPKTVSQLDSATTSTRKRKQNCSSPKRAQNCKHPKKADNSKDPYELLQIHSNEQERHLADISNSMSSLKRSMRDMNKFQKELLNIEAKKLELALERSEREKEMHESEMKIKTIKFSIKQKELELLNNNIQ